MERTLVWFIPDTSLEPAFEEMMQTGAYTLRTTCLFQPGVHLRELAAVRPRSTTVLLGNDDQIVEFWAPDEAQVMQALAEFAASIGDGGSKG